MNIITIFQKFPTQKDCIEYLEKARWGDKPLCAYCGSENNYRLIYKTQIRRHCNTCKKSFSATIGTIFEDSRLPLQKWFLAISLIMNAKKGISSRQLARDIEVTKDTAWSMQMRIREAMLDDGSLLSGICEMDEIYIGGKPRKEAKKDDDDTSPPPLKRGRGTKKQAVVGIISRKGKVKLSVEDKLTFQRLAELVRKGVDTDNSVLYTDEFRAYSRMKTIIGHKQVDHSRKEYSRNGVSTNTMESFWAIVKRGIVGQYHKVSKKYLARYLNEFAFRFNNRDNKMVFDDIVSGMLFCK